MASSRLFGVSFGAVHQSSRALLLFDADLHRPTSGRLRVERPPVVESEFGHSWLAGCESKPLSTRTADGLFVVGLPAISSRYHKLSFVSTRSQRPTKASRGKSSEPDVERLPNRHLELVIHPETPAMPDSALATA